MKTCFVVHDPQVARALLSHIGPDARVITPPGLLNGFAIDRLIVVDEPTQATLRGLRVDGLHYEHWLRELVATRLTAGAQLINVPGWARN